MRLLILDEPTASLTEQETSVLLDIIRDLQQHGIACIYISHKLNEVKAFPIRFALFATVNTLVRVLLLEWSEDDIITMMVGRVNRALP